MRVCKTSLPFPLNCFQDRSRSPRPKPKVSRAAACFAPTSNASAVASTVRSAGTSILSPPPVRLSAATPGAWISHVTAARLRCSCLPPWLADSTELHLSKPRSLPGARRKGVIGHRVIAAEDEVESVDGIRISTRPRTWLDMARLLPLNDLVCMGDELIRVPRQALEGRDTPFATLEELRALVERHPNLQGVVRARQALELMRVGADSAPESLLRLAMLDAGIPEPELQLSCEVTIRSRRRRIWGSANGGSPFSTTAAITSRRPRHSVIDAGTRPSRQPDGPSSCSARTIWQMVSSWLPRRSRRHSDQRGSIPPSHPALQAPCSERALNDDARSPEGERASVQNPAYVSERPAKTRYR